MEHKTASSSVDVSIIVVSYNTAAMTLECLESIRREPTAVNFEVIVVDNASSDGSAGAIEDRFLDDDRFRLISSEENVGFARANNLAARDAAGEFILLLNPDTIVLDDAIDAIVRFARSQSDYGIWGGRTFFADGSVNPTNCWARFSIWSQFCRYSGLTRFFSRSSYFNPRSYVDWGRDSIKTVDIVTGCFFLMRANDWRRLGGFDSTFFMYGEEVDLCMRAADAGLFPIVTPDASIVHYGGASEKVVEDKWVRILKAERALFDRHWSHLGSETARFLIYAGLLLRGLGASLCRAEGAKMWWALLRRRREWDVLA